jgi:hypothetical protein
VAYGGLGLHVLKYNKIAVLDAMVQLINSNQGVNSGETVFTIPSGFTPQFVPYVDIFIGTESVAHAYLRIDGNVNLHNSNISGSGYITFNCTYITV